MPNNETLDLKPLIGHSLKALVGKKPFWEGQQGKLKKEGWEVTIDGTTFAHFIPIWEANELREFAGRYVIIQVEENKNGYPACRYFEPSVDEKGTPVSKELVEATVKSFEKALDAPSADERLKVRAFLIADAYRAVFMAKGMLTPEGTPEEVIKGLAQLFTPEVTQKIVTTLLIRDAAEGRLP